MNKSILKEIINQAEELRSKYNQYHNNTYLLCKRNSGLLKNVKKKVIHKPKEWSKSKRFNPFYVLKNAEVIAHAISKKILNGNYSPSPVFIKQIAKKGGGHRDVCVYEIPDSAVSDKVYSDLLSKNKHRFSSFSYAYRNDRNVHYAIQDISYELSNSSRLFVAEFDFSDFFGSINHKYLLKQLDSNKFSISDIEKGIISAFLKDRDIGIPQGTSISLFLANLACWKLDRELESVGLRFARYADDTIIWSKDYGKICKAFEIIHAFSIEAGVKINTSKSEGISLLQKKGIPSELNNYKEYVEFLGYKISIDSIGIKKTSENNIKKQISYLLYKNLIRPAKNRENLNIPANGVDKDLLSTIMQIRRYLYGDLTENTLKKFNRGEYKRLSFKGVMTFYPLVNNKEQMKDLDIWLIITIYNVIKLRKDLLIKGNPNFNTNQFPFNVPKSDLVKQFRSCIINNKKGLLEIPSFFRICKALELGIKNYGIDRVMNPNSNLYYE